MPSKTKNKRVKKNRRHGKGTRGQRGGGYFSDWSDKLFGPSDSATTSSSSSWFEMPEFLKSDPNKPAFDWTFGLSKSTTPNSYPPNSYPPNSYPPNSDFTQNTPENKYSGGKKSKSCSHHHKHTKSCSK